MHSLRFIPAGTVIRRIFLTGYFLQDLINWGSVVILVYTYLIPYPQFVLDAITYAGDAVFYGYNAVIIAAIGTVFGFGIKRFVLSPQSAADMARYVLFEAGMVSEPLASWWAWPRFGMFWVILFAEALAGILWMAIGVWYVMAEWGVYIHDFLALL